MTTEEFLPAHEVERLTGISRSTIYRLSKAGQFPKPVKVSKKRAAWLKSEVIAWQKTLLERR